MPLGTELGLGPGHIVLDEDPASPVQKGTPQSPTFGPCLLWPKGWMSKWIRMPLGREVRHGRGDIVLDGDPAPQPKRAEQSPRFGQCLLSRKGRPSQPLLNSFVPYFPA